METLLTIFQDLATIFPGLPQYCAGIQ